MIIYIIKFILKIIIRLIMTIKKLARGHSQKKSEAPIIGYSILFAEL